MDESERQDLINILRDARRMDAADDALAILRALPWHSPEEKLAVWKSLPDLLRTWLSRAAAQPSTNDRRAI